MFLNLTLCMIAGFEGNDQHLNDVFMQVYEEMGF